MRIAFIAIVVCLAAALLVGLVSCTPNAGQPPAGGETTSSGGSGGTTPERSADVAALTERLLEDQKRQHQAPVSPEAGALRTAATEFFQALLASDESYRKYLLSDDEVKRLYPEGIAKILTGGRETSNAESRRQLQNWIGTQKVRAGEVTVASLQTATSRDADKPLATAQATVPFAMSLGSGKLTLDSCVLTSAGWRFVRFTPSLDR